MRSPDNQYSIRSLSFASMPILVPKGLRSCIDIFAEDEALTKQHFFQQLRRIVHHIDQDSAKKVDWINRLTKA